MCSAEVILNALHLLVIVPFTLSPVILNDILSLSAVLKQLYSVELFYDIISTAEVMRGTMFIELPGTGEEMFMVYFKVLRWYFFWRD